MKNILVTGGAGYIGSHTAKLLAENGFNPLIYDNLSTGYEFLAGDFRLIRGDIGDYEKLMSVFRTNDITAVMNFASFIAVGESVSNPLKYYMNNVGQTIHLLRAMSDSGVKKFIFSSTAAVYGYPDRIPITEDSALEQINPYGRTKYFIERVLADLERSSGFRSVCLRYFNAAGADPGGRLGECHIPETHLIPLAIRAAVEPSYILNVFGDDYETADGTCVRDYIHVNDLAMAHILALKKIISGGSSAVYNLGNGKGFSVLEIIESVKRVSGKTPSFVKAPRREGDPPSLVASSEKARAGMGWEPAYRDIDSIISTAWLWETSGGRRGY